MNPVSVQKAARALNLLVWITLVCNLLAFYLVPTIVMQNYTLREGIEPYLSSFFLPGEDDIVAAAVSASFLAWFWVWRSAYTAMLTVFLIVAGICTSLILLQGRRVLRTILLGKSFSAENASSLKHAATCCFAVSIAALVRMVYSICFYHSLRPLLTYNAFFISLFAIAGLLSLVMSSLFRQAAELKDEHDLTI